jgi:hypothetical protein
LPVSQRRPTAAVEAAAVLVVEPARDPDLAVVAATDA